MGHGVHNLSVQYAIQCAVHFGRQQFGPMKIDPPLVVSTAVAPLNCGVEERVVSSAYANVCTL